MKAASVEVVDITGRVVRRLVMNGKQLYLSTTDLENGIYTVSIIGNQQIVIKKLVIQR